MLASSSIKQRLDQIATTEDREKTWGLCDGHRGTREISEIVESPKECGVVANVLRKFLVIGGRVDTTLGTAAGPRGHQKNTGGIVFTKRNQRKNKFLAGMPGRSFIRRIPF